MADIAITSFFSSDFSYDREQKMFTEEISTLSQGGRRQVFSQVYDDACDEGFKMISKVTGKIVYYVVDSEDRDGENELQGWRLVPTRDSIRRVPECKGTSVLIIND
jgi:hypothetical protein